MPVSNAEICRRWRQRYPERFKKSKRNWERNHPEYKRQHLARWIDKNRDYYNQHHKEYVQRIQDEANCHMKIEIFYPGFRFLKALAEAEVVAI